MWSYKSLARQPFHKLHVLLHHEVTKLNSSSSTPRSPLPTTNSTPVSFNGVQLPRVVLDCLKKGTKITLLSVDKMNWTTIKSVELTKVGFKEELDLLNLLEMKFSINYEYLFVRYYKTITENNNHTFIFCGMSSERKNYVPVLCAECYYTVIVTYI